LQAKLEQDIIHVTAIEGCVILNATVLFADVVQGCYFELCEEASKDRAMPAVSDQV